MGVATRIEGATMQFDAQRWFARFLRAWLERARAADREAPVTFAYVVLGRMPRSDDDFGFEQGAAVTEVGFGDDPVGPTDGVSRPLLELIREGIDQL